MKDNTLFTLPLNQISEKCRQEDERFHNDRESDPRYCYELFRRAFLENSEAAWEMIYQQYYPQMMRWIQRKEGILHCGEEPAYFVNRGLGKFWAQICKKSFSEEFPHLGGILSYLRTCLTAEYIDYLRKNKMPKNNIIQVSLTERMEMTSASPISIESDFIRKENIENIRLWIAEEFSDEREKVVLESVYYYGLSANEILQLHSDLFKSKTHIYRVKENLMRRIRRKVQKNQIIHLSE